MGTKGADRIPLKVFMVVNGTLMGLALLLAAARIVIRFHSQKKIYPDDVVLMFACITFVASQALLYTLKIDSLYWHQPTDPQSFLSTLEDPEAFLRRITKLQRMEWSSYALAFASIFAVKICFLLFFHQMVTRLRRLLLAWKVIFGITILFGALGISATFITCNQFLPAILKCSSGRTQILTVTIILSFLDITSDLFLISIPVIVLWKAKIERQQKIFFGMFLCLSVCMIIIAIIRVSGAIQDNNYNLVWVLFWQQVEAAVAIIMVSITAFRSLLGIKARKARERKKLESSWFSHRQQLLARYFKKTTQDESKSQQLPSLPGATLTGMRTFINGSGICDEAMEISHMSENSRPRAASHEPQEIELAQLSTELDILDGAKSARAANFV